MISSEELAEAKRVAEAATPGPWHHCQAFRTVPAARTVHGPVPAERVDYVSTWPGPGTPNGHRVVVDMPGREGRTRSDDMAHIAHFNPSFCLRLLEENERMREALEGKDGNWVLVPREPTEAMLKAAFVAMNDTPSGTWKRMKAEGVTPRRMSDVKMAPRYRAMIDAAPDFRRARSALRGNYPVDVIPERDRPVITEKMLRAAREADPSGADASFEDQSVLYAAIFRAMWAEMPR